MLVNVKFNVYDWYLRDVVCVSTKDVTHTVIDHPCLVCAGIYIIRLCTHTK